MTSTDEVTSEVPIVLPEGGYEDDDYEWPQRSARRGIRMRVPTAVLLGLLIAGGGIWGGAALQRTRGTSGSGSNLSSLFSQFRGRGLGTGGGAGARTGSGSGGFAGTGSGVAAAGTVTVIEGNVVYITTASGAIEKVVASKATTVTRNAKTSIAGLRPGDTVVVSGTTEKNGSVAATSIAATQAGVTTFGGLGARLGTAGSTGTG